MKTAEQRMGDAVLKIILAFVAAFIILGGVTVAGVFIAGRVIGIL